jgi:hypothetical protein
VRRLLAAGALKSKDIKPHYVAALRATVTRGRTARLNYAVFDDSGKSREVVHVRGKRGVLATMSTSLRAVSPQQRYAVRWRVPKPRPAGDVTYCVVAYDPAGNHAKACAPVRF